MLNITNYYKAMIQNKTNKINLADFLLELASSNQVSEICELINLAYRGEDGWTRETKLISGNRSTPNEVNGYLLDQNAYLFIAKDQHEIVSCICIELNENDAHIGFFAVHPKLQGHGVGKIILAQAENYAISRLNAKKLMMTVVSQRELIAYYERRGYQRTGVIKNFPVHRDVGQPLDNSLTVEYMSKKI